MIAASESARVRFEDVGHMFEAVATWKCVCSGSSPMKTIAIFATFTPLNAPNARASKCGQFASNRRDRGRPSSGECYARTAAIGIFFELCWRWLLWWPRQWDKA